MLRPASTVMVALVIALASPAAPRAQGYPLTGPQSDSKTVIGEDIVYPTTGKAIITSAIVVLGPGERTITHRHGVPLFAYMIEGELTVDYGTRGKRVYRQGDRFFDAMSVSHFGLNTGSGPVRILAVYLGAEGSKDVIAD
jgi:quercetin dioxygenase-like cupin family protein